MKISKKFIRMEITGIAALLIGSFLITYLFNGKQMFSSFPRFFKGISFGFVFGFCFWQGNYFIARTAGRYLNWTKNAKKANTITLLLLLFYGLLVSISVSFFYYKYVFDIPTDRLFNHIMGSAFMGLTINFAIVGAYYSGFLAEFWMESIKNEERLKQEYIIAKYEALKNQVNPHFLFNTLNTLTGIVENDQHLATQYIKKLADTYRYVLEQNEKETVKISLELKFIDDFIYLQKMRYGEGLSFESHITDTNGLVAPLSLQILVENAIKHNVIAEDHPLNIELMEIDNYYVLKNNLQKKQVIVQHSGIGLENLTKRYEFMTTNKVDIQENHKEFVVKLPKITIEK